MHKDEMGQRGQIRMENLKRNKERMKNFVITMWSAHMVVWKLNLQHSIHLWEPLQLQRTNGKLFILLLLFFLVWNQFLFDWIFNWTIHYVFTSIKFKTFFMLKKKTWVYGKTMPILIQQTFRFLRAFYQIFCCCCR